AFGRPLLEKGAEDLEPVGLERHAGGHGMAAALDEDARGHRIANDAAEIDPGDRAPGPDQATILSARQHEGWPAPALLQPGGHEANDAGMEAGAVGEHDRGLPARHGRADGGIGLDQHRLLDRLTLPIEAVQQRGDAPGLVKIVGHQEAGAERSVPDTPAGIDARPDQEAEVVDRKRTWDAGGLGERGDAGIAAGPRYR